MFNTLRTKKGISIVEAMIAVFITSVAMVAIAGIQPIAIRTAAGSDYMGRAVVIAQAEAASREAVIMTTGAALLADRNNEIVMVQNIPFRVTTVTTPPPVPLPLACQNCWLVSVRVMWPQAVSGVTYNRVVTQQMGY